MKTNTEYFLQILLLWQIGHTRHDFLIILNRLLMVIFYSNLHELLSNECSWKKKIYLTRFDRNDRREMCRLTKDQLLLLIPAITVAYEILVVRSIIIHIIVCDNVQHLVEFSAESSSSINLFVQIVWLFVIDLIAVDWFLLFYLTNASGLVWFYMGFSQWNKISWMDDETNQSSRLYSAYLKFIHFRNENLQKRLLDIFFRVLSYANSKKEAMTELLLIIEFREPRWRFLSVIFVSCRLFD